MKIRLPISRKKHEQELESLEETTDITIQAVNKSKVLADERVVRLLNQTTKIRNDNSKLNIDHNALQHRYDSLCELHSNRIRIGSIVVDPIEITAKLRAVEPTIRVEFDGKRLFIYADRVLTDPEFNQLEGMLKVRIDRT